MRSRDSQREKLYKAERNAGWQVAMHHPGSFQTPGEVYGYIDKILRTKWAERQWPNLVQSERRHFLYRKVRPEIKFRSMSATAAKHQAGTLTFSPGHATPFVIVHELAHWLVSTLSRDYSVRKSPAGHGREFAAAFLKLVQHQFGKEIHDQMRKDFVAHGVKYRAKRTISPEQRAKLVERGRALQAARKAAALQPEGM